MCFNYIAKIAGYCAVVLHRKTRWIDPFHFPIRISRKISVIFYKIFSDQTVNRNKNERYSVFPAVNSSKQLITAVGREFTAVDESILYG
jgi:hypothetical protein